jgi:hypothetical protein
LNNGESPGTRFARDTYIGRGLRAANWRYLGETAGRGKLDRFGRAALPRKGVFAYPLRHDFRAALGVS